MSATQVYPSQAFSADYNVIRLLAPSDADFAAFLALLKSHQGDMLRSFSSAAGPILDFMFDGNLHHSEPFPLEICEHVDIAGLPRASAKLLSCFKFFQS